MKSVGASSYQSRSVDPVREAALCRGRQVLVFPAPRRLLERPKMYAGGQPPEEEKDKNR